jgi:cob(I)alamin adenosyltransferase
MNNSFAVLFGGMNTSGPIVDKNIRPDPGLSKPDKFRTAVQGKHPKATERTPVPAITPPLAGAFRRAKQHDKIGIGGYVMTMKKNPPALKGQIQIYTGDGKGKTTAALGLALRAAGHGYRTYFGQFLKARPSGERAAARKLGGLITFAMFGRPGLLQMKGRPDPEDVRRAERGLALCRKAMLSGRYDLVVMDEINMALYFGLIDLAAVLALIDEKPASVELILTGRRAPAALIRRAGLVTEMKAVKHYFAAGVRARRGIED